MDYAQRPDDSECFDYHRVYVAHVPQGNILETLETQAASAAEFIRRIAAEQMDIVHAPYGWKIRTVLEHCCDAERVFGYRALRFATGDPTDLPGWDENHYAACGYSMPVSQEALAAEFQGIRVGNLRLLQRLESECWSRAGTADGRRVSVRTCAWLMAGHWLHHESILRKRLGIDGESV
jgi:hypothetical protein